MTDAQIAALAVEITTDPTSQGYGALGTDYAAIAAKLNDPTTSTVTVTSVTPRDVIDAVDANEVPTLGPKLPMIQTALQAAVATDGRVKLASPMLPVLLAGAPNTLAAIQALASRPGSRAEVVLGVGARVDYRDVVAAVGPSGWSGAVEGEPARREGRLFVNLRFTHSDGRTFVTGELSVPADPVWLAEAIRSGVIEQNALDAVALSI